MQLGKSVNFCVAPFDGAPLCKIGDDRSVFATKDQANQLSHNLCRVLRHKIGNCRGSVFRCDEGGWVDIDAVIDDRNNDIFPPSTSRAKRYMGIMEVIKWQEVFDSLGGAFRVTYVENLPSIVRCGLDRWRKQASIALRSICTMG